MDKVGEYTLEVMREAGWYNDWLFKRVKKHIKGEILEVGTGIGNFTGLLKNNGRVTGIDISDKYISELKKKIRNVSLGMGNVETGSYFFRNKTFNTIICLNVLEHINDDKRALKNMFKLLKKDGKLILLVPAHKALYSKFDKKLGHFRRYTKEEAVEKLIASGFNIKENNYLNWWAAIGWLLFMKVMNKKKLPKQEVGIFNLLGKLFLWPEKFVSPPFGLSVIVIGEKK